MTIGVLNRAEELADRKEGLKPKGAIPFKSLAPLEEIIADVLNQGTGTKQVRKEYDSLIGKFGSEFNVLLDITKEKLADATLPEIAEGIIRVREGRVFKDPGYDGVYGRVRVFSKGEEKSFIKQKTLF
jgi:PHP family Zn ribbon phosphoesterase